MNQRKIFFIEKKPDYFNSGKYVIDYGLLLLYVIKKMESPEYCPDLNKENFSFCEKSMGNFFSQKEGELVPLKDKDDKDVITLYPMGKNGRSVVVDKTYTVFPLILYHSEDRPDKSKKDDSSFFRLKAATAVLKKVNSYIDQKKYLKKHGMKLKMNGSLLGSERLFFTPFSGTTLS